MSHHTYADEMLRLSGCSTKNLPLNIRTNWKKIWEECDKRDLQPSIYSKDKKEFHRLVRKHTVRLK